MCDELKSSCERLVPEGSPYDLVFQEHIGRHVFVSQFVNDKMVLDIASGAGYGSFYFCERGAAHVIGVDISFDTIWHADNRYQHKCLQFVLADATKIPFKDCTFELVVSFETIEHLKQYELLLSECARVLSDDGLFVCSTPNKKVFDCYPGNPYHVKEFYPVEFFGLANKYFSEVHRFGQMNRKVLGLNADKLLLEANKLLLGDINELLKAVVSSLLGGKIQGELWATLRRKYRTRNSRRKKKFAKKVDSQRSNNDGDFADVLLDDFKVTTFKDNRFVTPKFLLVLCKKPRNRMR